MQWSALTETDILTSLTSAEREGFASAVRTRGLDPVEGLLSDLCHEVRGKLGANTSIKQMPTGGVIPAEIKAAALAIARHRFLTWADVTVSAERKTEYENGVKFLDSASDAKKFRITEDNAPAPEPAKSSDARVPAVSTKPDRKLTGI